jgi:hypothetical protein
MVKFYYNYLISEDSTHSPFEVIYGYRSSTPAHRLLPLTIATANIADRLNLVADIRDVVNQLLKLSKERIAAWSTRLLLLFNRETLFIFGLKVYTSVNKNANTLEIKNKVHTRWYLRSVLTLLSWYLVLPKGCRLHHVFCCYFLSHASSSTSLRPQQAEIGGDHEKY